jgi:hypothetical protein
VKRRHIAVDLRPLVTDEYLAVHVALGGTEPIVPSRCCGIPTAAALVSASQSPLVDIRGCKRKAVFLILAVTPEKKLRTKPQLIRHSTEHLEAVA